MSYFKYFSSNLYKRHGLLHSLSLQTAGSYFYKNLQSNYFDKDIEFCGIVGYIKQTKAGTKTPIEKKNKASTFLAEGLLLLQNRGYDSAGLATMDGNNDSFFMDENENPNKINISKVATDLKKGVDCIESIKNLTQDPKHKNACIGIGHTRWATCGGRTDNNAHPHYDESGTIAQVHNGIILNYQTLKQELVEEGIVFTSQTDSEVIAQLIGYNITRKKMAWGQAVREALSRLEGTWGLVIMNKNQKNSLIVCRNGSPIIVGLGDNELFVASEALAFEKHTLDCVALKEGEIVEICADDESLSTAFKQRKERRVSVDAELYPHPDYKTFFEQEIYSQPKSIANALNNGARISAAKGFAKLKGLEENLQSLIKIRNLLILGCGTSYFSALAGEYYMRRQNCFNTVMAIEASNFTEYDIPEEDCGAILISQSGETMDLYIVLKKLKKHNVTCIGIVNVVGSLIARSVDCGIYMNAGREVAVPATKSFSNAVVILVLSAIWFSYHNDAIKKEEVEELRKSMSINLQQLPSFTADTLSSCKDQCKKAAEILFREKSTFIIAKGPGLCMAHESCQKMKETTYIHAEAFASGNLKHGPLAMIDCENAKSTKQILFIQDDWTLEDMKVALSEINAREGYTIVITDCFEKLDSSKIDFTINLPKGQKFYGNMLCNVCMQMVTQYLCNIKGINPDKPRNLAKTVTVI